MQKETNLMQNLRVSYFADAMLTISLQRLKIIENRVEVLQQTQKHSQAYKKQKLLFQMYTSYVSLPPTLGIQL